LAAKVVGANLRLTQNRRVAGDSGGSLARSVPGKLDLAVGSGEHERTCSRRYRVKKKAELRLSPGSLTIARVHRLSWRCTDCVRAQPVQS
jgi:hypothetical protein